MQQQGQAHLKAQLLQKGASPEPAYKRRKAANLTVTVPIGVGAGACAHSTAGTCQPSHSICHQLGLLGVIDCLSTGPAGCRALGEASTLAQALVWQVASPPLPVATLSLSWLLTACQRWLHASQQHLRAGCVACRGPLWTPS